MKKIEHYILLGILLYLVIGCAGKSIHTYIGPDAIIIRNSTKIDIETVSLKEVKQQNQYLRVGAISPLPAGVSQYIGRSTNPPRLPGKIFICWTDGSKQEVCKQKEIALAIKKHSAQGKALVFDILSLSDVTVYIENIP